MLCIYVFVVFETSWHSISKFDWAGIRSVYV